MILLDENHNVPLLQRFMNLLCVYVFLQSLLSKSALHDLFMPYTSNQTRLSSFSVSFLVITFKDESSISFNSSSYLSIFLLSYSRVGADSYTINRQILNLIYSPMPVKNEPKG